MTLHGRVVDFGGFTSEALLKKLTDAGVRLNEHAHDLLGRVEFEEEQWLGQIRVVVRTVGDLGFVSGASLEQIFVRAVEHGLALCPLVAGPYLRLATLDQASSRNSVLSDARSPADSLTITSPVGTMGSGPTGFYLRIVDDVPWLRGYRCDGDSLFAPEDAFIFHNPIDA